METCINRTLALVTNKTMTNNIALKQVCEFKYLGDLITTQLGISLEK